MVDLSFRAGRSFDQLNQPANRNRLVVPQIDTLTCNVRRCQSGNDSAAYVANVREIAKNGAIAKERQRRAFQNRSRKNYERKFRPQPRAIHIEEPQAHKRHAKKLMVRESDNLRRSLACAVGAGWNTQNSILNEGRRSAAAVDG